MRARVHALVIGNNVSVLINGICLFGAWRRKAPTASSAKLDGKYKRLRRVVA